MSMQNFAFSSFCLEIRIRHGGIRWEKEKTAFYSATGLSLAFLTLILLLVKVCVKVLTAQVHSRPTNHYYDFLFPQKKCIAPSENKRRKKSTFSLMCAFSPVVSYLLYSSPGAYKTGISCWMNIPQQMPWLSAFLCILFEQTWANRENKTADFEYMLLSSYRDWLIPWQPSLKKTFWCSVCPLKTLCSSYGCFVYQAVCFLVTD